MSRRGKDCNGYNVAAGPVEGAGNQIPGIGKCPAKAIDDGVLAPGSKLPPVRELAYRISVTPGTVARAYSLLIDEGLLEAGVGRGTFVADQPRYRERTQ